MYITQNKKHAFAAILFALSFIFIPVSGLYAANDEEVLDSWTGIVKKMEVHLNNAYDLYTQGKSKEAYDEVNVAYFRFYESKGMEKITMGYLSGARKTTVENAFYEYRRNVYSDKDNEMVKAHKDKLIAMLYHDAAELDGTLDESGSETANTAQSAVVATFISCFVLVLREGLEAILVIAAIIAYLVKTGKKKYIMSVYVGALGGILVSILLAFLFGAVAGAQSGIAQEVFEGIGMFVAVIVLFYVSNWMLSKSETEAWERYIHKKVEASVSTGNKWVLIFAAFIAVAREGAELILFFQGVPVHGTSGRNAMILAIVLSAVVLIAVFLVFRFLTVRLPLKPFFLVTSILMYAMCFSFTGKGVSELQAAGVVNKTVIPWMSFEMDFLGIYATYESLIPQIIVLAVIITMSVVYAKKNKQQRAQIEAEKARIGQK
ncbi:MULTISPECIES: FTR1 family protein [unclassified Treponema]|uniref:FTR1 family iron permease n=1 Tax=unclassified Treponema TaxID=2638727 RepID=UPI00053011EC|nr:MULTISPECIES: FTR1 family protein [unclassified Treponema]AIW90026.1 iron transporter [Treponema sp. OMZ 838]UTC43422.1 FTR1 family iron permease [Treponema sp. OMZ 857]UTC49993.1 FTR1 family iron permease [Treponema sp. OMZ 855]